MWVGKRLGLISLNPKADERVFSVAVQSIVWIGVEGGLKDLKNKHKLFSITQWRTVLTDRNKYRNAREATLYQRRPMTPDRLQGTDFSLTLALWVACAKPEATNPILQFSKNISNCIGLCTSRCELAYFPTYVLRVCSVEIFTLQGLILPIVGLPNLSCTG